ncbi:phage tail protein [Escherichia coli]
MADSNLNTPVIVQATRLDTSILPRNIFSQSYLLYVIAQGTDVGNVANKANEAGQGAYDAQVRNDEQDVILVDHEERIRQLRIEVDDHEIRIAANTAAIAALDVRLTTAEGEIVTLQADVSALDGRVQGQANAGQTYANNMSQISQQSAALAAANANRPSALQQGVSGAASGALLGGGIASALELSTPWGAGIGAGLGLLGSLF